jgi:hypothetical protein
MESKRKLQLGATAAVIANGLFALSLAPSPALATSCPEQAKCACGNLAYCQSIALPGCTAVGGQFCLNLPGCGEVSYITICEYQ